MILVVEWIVLKAKNYKAITKIPFLYLLDLSTKTRIPTSINVNPTPNIIPAKIQFSSFRLGNNK